MSETLRYTLRPGADPSSPIAFMVHGRAGSVSVMTTFARILPEDWALVFVQAPIVDPIGGYSWWDIQDSLNKDSQRAASVEMLSTFVHTFAGLNQLSPEFSVALGFSQGAAMISVLIQHAPLMFKSVALLSGFILTQASVPSTIKPSVLVVHGTVDEVIPLAQIESGIEFLQHQGYEVNLHTEAVGHKVGVQGMRVLKEWARAL